MVQTVVCMLNFTGVKNFTGVNCQKQYLLYHEQLRGVRVGWHSRQIRNEKWCWRGETTRCSKWLVCPITDMWRICHSYKWLVCCIEDRWCTVRGKSIDCLIKDERMNFILKRLQIRHSCLLNVYNIQLAWVYIRPFPTTHNPAFEMCPLNLCDIVRLDF